MHLHQTSRRCTRQNTYTETAGQTDQCAAILLAELTVVVLQVSSSRKSSIINNNENCYGRHARNNCATNTRLTYTAGLDDDLKIIDDVFNLPGCSYSVINFAVRGQAREISLVIVPVCSQNGYVECVVRVSGVMMFSFLELLIHSHVRIHALSTVVPAGPG